jgi:predicted Ser/Thr protein kinase
MTSGAWDQTTVGPYRLLNRLGEGGMGVVHLAVGPDERAVAVKVLRAHVAADPDARLRLAREVDTLRRVRHPRVAEVLDADTDGELPYLVTRFVPGRTLEDLVRERGPMPLDRVVHTGKLLADALRSIHAAGVVHRDVKPANVMLVDDDPVLIDFGIAHVADESRITMTGLVMGTPGYLSPEVVGGHPVTPATDWWGWGSTLAFAATGRPPFGTGPIEVVLDRVRRGAPDLTGLDERLRSVVLTALAAEPSTRPPADWLVGALEGVLRSTGGTATRAAAATVANGTPAAPPAAPASAPPVDREGRTVVHARSEAPPRAGRENPAAAATVVTPSPAAPTVPHAHAAPTTRTPPPAAPTTPHRATPTLVDTPVRPGPQPPGRPPLRPAVPAAAGLAVRPAPAPPGPAPSVPAVAPGPGAAAPPPEHPTSLLLGALLTFCALTAVAPGAAVVLLGLWMVVARTADRSALGVWRRRYAYGPRGSDVPVTVALVPWRATVAALMSLFALIVPVLVGASVAFIIGSAMTGGTTLTTPTQPAALAAAGGAAAVTAWWGPGGSSMRRGTTWLARLAVRRRGLHLGLLVFLGFVVAAALIVLANSTPPDFAPFQGPGL